MLNPRRTLSLSGAIALKMRESRGGVPDLTGYWDANGAVPTAGWGHAGEDVKVGEVYTQKQVEDWFDQDTQWAINAANEAITNEDISSNQFDAFVSALYNVGPGQKGVQSGLITLINGKPSTVLQLINSGSYADLARVPGELLKWVHDAQYPAPGPGDPGLINRRNSEGGQWVRGSVVKSSGVTVAPPPSIFTQAHMKLKVLGTTLAGTGIGADAFTHAGDKLTTLSTTQQFLHTFAPYLGAAGVILTVLGILVGVFRKDS